MSNRILILGALGQIGSELTDALRQKYGIEAVIASDVKDNSGTSGPYVKLDATNYHDVEKVVDEWGISEVYNLVAMLSATAEQMPMKGWNLNMDSLFVTLELAKAKKIKRLFWPSSIAAFGPNSPKAPCIQSTVMDPSTVYGISKLSGELWCQYYFEKYGVDVRSVRYPGLISYKTLPGGGTTDYAVDIFFKALRDKKYTSYIAQNTRLPMMYMDDAIEATIKLMEAPSEEVKIRTSYNLAAFSFTPQELGVLIKKYVPDFELDYSVDYRDGIAQGWPQVMDDMEARTDWGYMPKFSLESMVAKMLNEVARL